MDVEFYCPECGRALLADSGFVGKPVHCPGCLKMLTVPDQDRFVLSRTDRESEDPQPTGERVCPHCGKRLNQLPGVDRIPNYLTSAILVTLFCCLPLGIPAIIYAAQVNVRLNEGDSVGARDMSDKARRWSWAAFYSGLAIFTLSAFLHLIFE